MQFCALDDAHVFLMEARGLPAIPSASARLGLCLRTSIFLSWTGLDDGLDHIIEDLGARGKTLKALPTKLKLRMLAFLLPLSEPLFVNADFDRLRRVRNELAHPVGKQGALQLTVKDAEQTLQFCLTIVRALGAYRIAIRQHEVHSRMPRGVVREMQKMPSVKERKIAVVAAIGRKSAAQ
jgi:hypothetical protein